MLERAAMYGLPAVGGLLIVAVLLGPGAEREVAGARVSTIVCRGARHVGLRVRAVGHLEGQYRSLPDAELAVRLLDAGGRLLGGWRGNTDGQGVAEANLATSEPLDGQPRVEVQHAGRLLGEGQLRLREPLRQGPASPPRRTEGTPPLAVLIPRGLLVPEIAEPVTVRIWVRQGSTATSLSPPRMVASGADVGPPTGPLVTSSEEERCTADWTVAVTARAPVVELEATANEGGESNRWRGELPVVVGGMWLAPDARDTGTITVVAATAKQAAYLSLLGPLGRVWGAFLPLHDDANGSSRGSLPLPELHRVSHTLVVSSDADEPGASLARWPLDPSAPRLEEAEIEVSLDGVPAAVAAEQQRVLRARLPVVGLVLATAMFELLMLWRRSRASAARLRRHLARAVDGDAASRSAQVRKLTDPVPLVAGVLMAALALSFAVLAAVAMWAKG